MSRLIFCGLILGGGSIAFDRLLWKLPDGLAVALFSTAMILVVLGMIRSKKTS